MAKYLKNNVGVVLSEITDRELLALFKIQVNCRIFFTNSSEEEIDEIFLGLREETVGKAIIQMTYQSHVQHVGYDKLIELINANRKLGGKLHIEIEKSNFKEQEPLLLILDQIKEEIVKSCVSISYNLKDKIYSIIYLRKNKINEKIFYFEDNDSILAFTENGPQIHGGKTSSIEDIICD